MINDIKNRFPFSAFTLKMVALITMVIDHFGMYAYSYALIDDPTNDILRQIGRISFVLFAFTVAESFVHTSNKEKYLSRLLLFGIGIEVVYYLINIAMGYQDSGVGINIFITLFLGALTCYLFELKGWKKLLFLFPLLFIVFTPKYIEYGFYGVGMIFLFYLFKDSSFWKVVALVIWNFLCLNVMPPLFIHLQEIFTYVPTNGLIPANMLIYQQLSILAIPFILLYNGKRGYASKFMKWFFYFFYPLHLALLQIIFWLI